MRHVTEAGGPDQIVAGPQANDLHWPSRLPDDRHGHVVLPYEREAVCSGHYASRDHPNPAKRRRHCRERRCALISALLKDGQFDALVSLTLNPAAEALQRSAPRRKVNRGEHDGVPAELMKRVWAAGEKAAVVSGSSRKSGDLGPLFMPARERCDGQR